MKIEASYVIIIGEVMFAIGHSTIYGSALTFLLLGCFNLTLGLLVALISHLNEK